MASPIDAGGTHRDGVRRHLGEAGARMRRIGEITTPHSAAGTAGLRRATPADIGGMGQCIENDEDEHDREVEHANAPWSKVFRGGTRSERPGAAFRVMWM